MKFNNKIRILKSLLLITVVCMYELWYMNNTKVNMHLLNMIIKKKQLVQHTCNKIIKN